MNQSQDKQIVALRLSGPYSNDFAKVFSKLLKKADTSCYKISDYAYLDEAYLSRLRNGEKKNPSPQTLIKISLAFAHLSPVITINDIEKLFNSVGRTISPPY